MSWNVDHRRDIRRIASPRFDSAALPVHGDACPREPVASETGWRNEVPARISTKDRNWLLKVRDNFSKWIGEGAACIENQFLRAYPVSRNFII